MFLGHKKVFYFAEFLNFKSKQYLTLTHQNTITSFANAKVVIPLY